MFSLPSTIKSCLKYKIDANAYNNNDSKASNCLPVANNGSNQPSFISDIDFEIVGLFSSSNGRLCCFHKVCSQHVCIDDVICLVKTDVDIGEVTRGAIKQ
jgi:hypothetical protein